MRFIKAYIIIAVLSALTGALLNVLWYLAGGDPVNAHTLPYYMTVGLIFGTVVYITLSIIMMKVRRAAYAYLINAIVEAVLMVTLFLIQNIEYPQWCNISKWIILLLASEFISTWIVTYWYHKMLWYNHRLVEKKRDLDRI